MERTGIGCLLGVFILLSGLLCPGPGLTAFAASVLLDIPPRRQWDNNQGYCGACSVQQSALYHGAYVSQYAARAVIDPDNREQILVGVNMRQLLEALSFKYESWPHETASTPQYRNYLVWCAKHLQNLAPVIITTYIKGLNDPDYDHIMVAVGFDAVDPESYDPNSRIVFNDCFVDSSFTRSFGSFHDKRSMQINGAIYKYCIPETHDYGIAVTGIKDMHDETLPVHLSIGTFSEPNVTMGEAPETVNAVITIHSLVAGRAYALLRYDNYSAVPSENFTDSNFDMSWSFVAGGTTYNLADQFPSDRIIIYRCVATREVSHYVDASGNCGGRKPCHRSIQEAVEAAATGSVVKIAAGNYREAVVLNQAKAITLSGGWNPTFRAQTPNTTSFEGVKAVQGSLRLKMVTLKPL